MVEPARQVHDFEDYLRLEEISSVKHEFLGGHVWAMAGGTLEHARVAVRIGTILNVGIGGRRCSVQSSDFRVRVRATGLTTYPDLSVICDHVELDPEDKKGQTALNPTVLVEVPSPTTEVYDCGEKLEHYKQIASLQEVMLVHHDARRVVVWRRSGASWSSTEYADDAIVELRSIDCKLGIAEIYRDPLA